VQDLLIVPTFDRPEMLWLCLEHIAKSHGTKDVLTVVYVDAHVGHMPPRDEIEQVIAKFPQLSIRVIYRQPHTFHGNSFNVMMAFKDAYHTKAEHVFMIEDDVMVHPDFFLWHRQQHADQALGCSIGVVKEPQYGHYASLGVCFQRDMLRLIVPHCQVAYFSNLRAYCKTRFPPSKTDCEQDGVFCRVLEGLPVAWPLVPYAQHVGWYGYHRKKSVRPQGDLYARYQQVKYVLTNPVVLRQWVKDFGDIKLLQLSATSGTVSSAAE
jgi:hypothetical protein